jgi:hypothetical protein
MTPAFRTEAVAAVAEPALEDRLDHESDCLLDDAILDRGYSQRSHPAVALRNLDPLDGLRAVSALPQGRRQLRQINICLRCEPFHALPVHARRASVRLDLHPGEFQRFARVHLVYQRVPFAAFDAVTQRRQHAIRPHLGFNPRPAVADRCGLCILLSLLGTADAALPWHDLHASTFLPCLPSDGFCCPFLQRPFSDRSGTMRALTPHRLAHTGKASLLTLLCRLSIPPPTTPWAWTSPSHPRWCAQPSVATQASSWNRKLAAPQRRNGFVMLRAARSPPAAPHLAFRKSAVERRSCLRLHVA